MAEFVVDIGLTVCDASQAFNRDVIRGREVDAFLIPARRLLYMPPEEAPYDQRLRHNVIVNAFPGGR